MNTAKWLRELGAVRPMAPAASEVLVLGVWRDGVYPITWTRTRDTISRDFNGELINKEPIEVWRLFGITVSQPLTKDDCTRILDHAGIEYDE